MTVDLKMDVSGIAVRCSTFRDLSGRDCRNMEVCYDGETVKQDEVKKPVTWLSQQQAKYTNCAPTRHALQDGAVEE